MHASYKYSFILRLWCVEVSEPNAWRASLEIPETGKRIGFASLEQLFAYLLDFSESNCDLQIVEGQRNKDRNELKGIQ